MTTPQEITLNRPTVTDRDGKPVDMDESFPITRRALLDAMHTYATAILRRYVAEQDSAAPAVPPSINLTVEAINLTLPSGALDVRVLGRPAEPARRTRITERDFNGRVVETVSEPIV